MSALGPQIVPDVIAHCQMAAGEIGQAFTRAFDYTVQAALGRSSSLSFARMRDELSSPGLAVVLHIGGPAVAILIPETGGVLPPSYASPDPPVQDKLATLAQELGMLCLPETLMADNIESVRVGQLAAALRAGGAAEGSAVVRLSLSSEGKQTEALVVWPLTDPKNIANSGAEGDLPAQTSGNGATPEDGSASAGLAGFGQASEGEAAEGAGTASTRAAKATTRGPSLRDLPTYTRSLLKIRVPLSVTLAAKKQPVGQILEIGPGSILQFEKSCEEMLDLNVSNLPIARGEAVKVGEKFGLRVTSLILPGERFKAVRPGLQYAKPQPD